MTANFFELEPSLIQPDWSAFARSLYDNRITAKLMTGHAVRQRWDRIRQKMAARPRPVTPRPVTPPSAPFGVAMLTMLAPPTTDPNDPVVAAMRATLAAGRPATAPMPKPIPPRGNFTR